MPRTQRAAKRNAATVQKPAAGARFDSKTRLLDQAILLARQGRFAESEPYFREVLRLRPDDVEVLNELGAAVWRQDRWAEAEAIFLRACEVRPDDFRTLNNLGLALYEQGRLDEAGDCYRRALQLRPDAFNAQMNLGIVLSDQGKLDVAMEWFLTAQKLQPNSIEILQNLAMNLGRQGRSPEAIELLRTNPAPATRPRRDSRESGVCACSVPATTNAAGESTNGDWKSDKHPGYRINRPLWNGEDIHDRTILLHTEQGFGDNLQFIRFAALVKKRAGFVLALCQTPLLKLIARCNGVDMAVEGSSYQPNCDVHAPFLSLPAIFGTTLDTLPAQVPYLVTDKVLVDHWGAELAKATAV